MIFEYIEKNSLDPVTRLNAQLHLIDIALLEDIGNKELNNLESRFNELVEVYGYQPETLQLQILKPSIS